MTDAINIGGRRIGREYPPFIIAEMSGNHGQSLDRALAIVEAAAKSGAHALKLQTYTADTITIDKSTDEFFIANPDSPGNGASLYSLYKQANTPWEWHKPIIERCKQLGIICFSAPFDFSSVDFLESLAIPAYKIASFENIDIPLIKKAAATGKPLFISTGMASIAELDDAVTAARDAGCRDIVLLKCTSTYPAAPGDANINTLPHLRDLFKTEVGLSDHTRGIGVALAAVALGATVIEKHFTLQKSDGGVDSHFSLEPDELKTLVVESERAWQSLGSIQYGPTEKEIPSLLFRRSLYVVRDMKAGETVSPENVRSIRPGNGLAPKHYDQVMGRKITRDAKKGTPLSWDILFGTPPSGD